MPALNQNPSLHGRVAIVTGAGKGLGRAYALHLAACGASVLVNNRHHDEPPGERSADLVCAEITRAGGRASANVEDVAAIGAGDELVASALAEFGRLDIIVSNAGIDNTRSFHRQPLSDFEAVMRINFHSVAALLHAAWPHLREARYGRVVLSTSTAGLWGNHGQAAYSASKAALLGLMRALTIEGAGRNIRVNAVAPYAVTQLTEPWFPAQHAARFGADAVAPLVSWLVSEQCELSGNVLISGAGRVRLAKALESGSIDLGSDPAQALATLRAQTCNIDHPSANAEFEDFTHSIAAESGQ